MPSTGHRRNRKLPDHAQPRRLLFVITSTDTGGFESVLYEMTARLDRRRFELLVCSLRPCGHIASEMMANGVRVFSLNLRDTPSLVNLLLGIRRLARVLDDCRIDLVHSFLYRANLISPMAARLSRRGPRVITGHGSLAPMKGRMAVLTARLSQHLSHCAVANCEAVREYLVAKEGARRSAVQVIYNGIDTTRFCAAPSDVRAKFDIPAGTFVVAAAGRHTAVKGYDDLLRAVAKVERPLHLLLAGDGPERPRLEQVAGDLGISDRVRFLGVVKDMSSLYHAADVFVLSSLREGFPNVVMEAMASGCAVVATRVGGVPEIIEDATSGLIIEPSNPQELASAITRLASDRDFRVRLADAGHRRVKRHFAIERGIAAHEALYERVLNS